MKHIFLLAILFTLGTTRASSQISPPPPPSEESDDSLDKIFSRVQQEAVFPGGQAGWADYLRHNLRGEVAANNRAHAGKYRVVVRFIVSKDGTVTDVRATTACGYGMENEVIRVIRSGPKWIPAQQNGRIVNAYREQPVVFAVAE